MYFDPFWVGLVTGIGVGWVSLVALVYGAAKVQQKNGRRPK